jgi:hypothetical protein
VTYLTAHPRRAWQHRAQSFVRHVRNISDWSGLDGVQR